MDEKLLKKLQKQSVEMARRVNIPVEEALAILVKGRSWASKQPIPDGTDGAAKVMETPLEVNLTGIKSGEAFGSAAVSLEEHPVPVKPADSPAGTFEQKIAEAIQSGANADVAFQRAVRANPAEAREYFLKQAKGEKGELQ